MRSLLYFAKVINKSQYHVKFMCMHLNGTTTISIGSFFSALPEYPVKSGHTRAIPAAAALASPNSPHKVADSFKSISLRSFSRMRSMFGVSVFIIDCFVRQGNPVLYIAMRCPFHLLQRWRKSMRYTIGLRVKNIDLQDLGICVKRRKVRPSRAVPWNWPVHSYAECFILIHVYSIIHRQR